MPLAARVVPQYQRYGQQVRGVWPGWIQLPQSKPPQGTTVPVVMQGMAGRDWCTRASCMESAA